MSSLDELYKEVILDHYRSPRNRGKLEPSDFDLHRDNPLCGDEIHVYAQVEDGKIKGISFEDAEGLANQFKSMMQGENPQDPDRLGDLVALQGVQKYPVRIKCALLGWNTFLEGLK